MFANGLSSSPSSSFSLSMPPCQPWTGSIANTLLTKMVLFCREVLLDNTECEGILVLDHNGLADRIVLHKIADDTDFAQQAKRLYQFEVIENNQQRIARVQLTRTNTAVAPPIVGMIFTRQLLPVIHTDDDGPEYFHLTQDTIYKMCLMQTDSQLQYSGVVCVTPYGICLLCFSRGSASELHARSQPGGNRTWAQEKQRQIAVLPDRMQQKWSTICTLLSDTNKDYKFQFFGPHKDVHVNLRRQDQVPTCAYVPSMPVPMTATTTTLASKTPSLLSSTSSSSSSSKHHAGALWWQDNLLIERLLVHMYPDQPTALAKWTAEYFVIVMNILDEENIPSPDPRVALWREFVHENRYQPEEVVLDGLLAIMLGEQTGSGLCSQLRTDILMLRDICNHSIVVNDPAVIAYRMYLQELLSSKPNMADKK